MDMQLLGGSEAADWRASILLASAAKLADGVAGDKLPRIRRPHGKQGCLASSG